MYCVVQVPVPHSLPVCIVPYAYILLGIVQVGLRGLKEHLMSKREVGAAFQNNLYHLSSRSKSFETCYRLSPLPDNAKATASSEFRPDPAMASQIRRRRGQIQRRRGQIRHQEIQRRHGQCRCPPRRCSGHARPAQAVSRLFDISFDDDEVGLRPGQQAEAASSAGRDGSRRWF